MEYPQAVYLGDGDFWFKLDENERPFITNYCLESVERCIVLNTKDEASRFANAHIFASMLPTKTKEKLENAIKNLYSIMKNKSEDN